MGDAAWMNIANKREAEKMKIDELDLSTRTYNVLLRAGIKTTEKIKEMTDDDLRHIKNLNEKCLKEVKRAVYCTDCKRSIYSDFPSCDINIENNGMYVLNGECKCKVI